MKYIPLILLAAGIFAVIFNGLSRHKRAYMNAKAEYAVIKEEIEACKDNETENQFLRERIEHVNILFFRFQYEIYENKSLATLYNDIEEYPPLRYPFKIRETKEPKGSQKC